MNKAIKALVKVGQIMDIVLVTIWSTFPFNSGNIHRPINQETIKIPNLSIRQAKREPCCSTSQETLSFLDANCFLPFLFGSEN